MQQSEDERFTQRTPSTLAWQFIANQPQTTTNTNPDNIVDSSYKDEELDTSNNRIYVQDSGADDSEILLRNNNNDNNTPSHENNNQQSSKSTLSSNPLSPQSHVARNNELRFRWQSASQNDILCSSFDSTLSQDSSISLNRSSPAIMDLLDSYESSELNSSTSPRPAPLLAVSSNLSSESNENFFSILAAQNHVNVDYYSVAYPESATAIQEDNNNSPRNNNDVPSSTLPSKDQPRVDPNDNNNTTQKTEPFSKDIQNMLITGEQLSSTLQLFLGQASNGNINQDVANKLKLSLLSMLKQVDGPSPSQQEAPKMIHPSVASFSAGEPLVDPIKSTALSTRNWNDEFQQILSLAQSTPEERLLRFEKITAITNDFQHTAKLYGKIIISESCLPLEAKSIKPVHIGGQAGGEKYIHAGILFKFVSDWHQIYGSDEYSMKAANHELKGLNRYFAASMEMEKSHKGAGLHFPLFTVIDYLGFRLIAMSILPIRKDTLIYGSCNYGITVYNQDTHISQLMETIAKKLNLKGHYAGRSNLKFIHTPLDIEIHQGKDGRFYLIDAARVFPPTTPESGVRSCYLHKLMRPEFVKTYQTPLDPDAYSPFDKKNPDRETNRKEISDATQYLFMFVIPKFANFMDSNTSEYFYDSNATAKLNYNRFIELLHRAGINVRYLGMVREHSRNQNLRRLILAEMVARTVKNLLRERFREISKSLRKHSFVPYTAAVTQLFNAIVSAKDDVTQPLQYLPNNGEDKPQAQPEPLDFWREDKILAILRQRFPRFPSLNDLEVEVKSQAANLNVQLQRAIVNQVCTYVVTGKMYLEQTFYRCFTCGLADNMGCCIVCAKLCHKGHNLSRIKKKSGFYCDCWIEGHCKAKSQKKLIHSDSDDHVLKEIVLHYIGPYQLFKRIQQLSGIELSNSCLKDLKENPQSFLFVSTDISKFGVLSKSMNYTLIAEANALHLKSCIVERGRKRVFEMAMKKFDQAIATIPDSCECYANYARVLKEQAMREAPAIDWRLLGLAARHYKNADDVKTVMELLRQLKSTYRYTNDYFDFHRACNQLLLESHTTENSRKYLGRVSELNLIGCSVTKDNLIAIATWFSNIRSLILTSVQGVYYDDLSFLIPRLPQLEELNLAHCSGVTDLIVEEISQYCSNLKLLDLSYTSVEGETLGHLLQRCQMLQQLNLAGLTRIVLYPEVFQYLSQCVHLVSLNLGGNIPIDDQMLRSIVKSLPHLKELYLFGKQLTNWGLTRIANYLPNLEVLELDKCDYASDDSLKVIIANCTQLESIHLPGCLSLSNSTFKSIPNLKNLVSLYLCGNPRLNDYHLDRILESCTMLQRLDLSHCRGISRDCLGRISYLPLLQHLNLSGCHVGDGTIGIYSQSGLHTSLISLYLCYSKITDLSLFSIGANFMNLTRLNVSCCHSITFPALKQLIDDLKSLQCIEFDLCDKITKDHKAQITDVHPRLVSFNNLMVWENWFFADYTTQRNVHMAYSEELSDHLREHSDLVHLGFL